MHQTDCNDAPAVQADVSHEVISRLAAQVLEMSQQPFAMTRTEAAIEELEDDFYDEDDYLLDTEDELFTEEE